ncbi:MAG: thiamine pyrophosphate-binding protein [Alphaproteobacteria bacterium]|nr:thiamine pyrophosphate-binding protein [Alphaproteobacteria bacterium]
MPTMSPWRAVAEALRAEGVDRVFGLPGNPIHLLPELDRHTKIQNILVRHEHSGVALAFAYARVTGKPAICYGNPGPGITNMATALLEATSASVPVIALANGVPMGSDGKGAFQELDSVAHMRPVTKWATRIVDPKTTPWVMQRAFSLAKQGRPGAVFIDIPSDIALGSVAMESYRVSPPRLRSRPEAAAVAAAAKLLARAKAPILLCGSGAISAGAQAQIRAIAGALGMPVFTTPGGRGSIAEGHALAFGQVGLYFTRLGKEVYDAADLILSVGSRLEDFSTGAWQLYPKGAKLIQLDIDPHAIAMNWRPAVALVGDAALALDDLLAALPATDSAVRRERGAALAKSKATFLRVVAAEGARKRKPILTRQVLAALNRVFGHDTILVNENGGADLWSYYWPYYKVLDEGDCVPMGEQTAMGMGVIGAIAAKLARPDKNVVCVAGDAALQMAMMELATAAEHKAGITWLVLNNQALGWPQYIQMLEGLPRVATDFAVSPDFVKLAEAQGCKGIRVTDPTRVEGALKAALALNRRGVPVLLDVHIAKHDYPPHFTAFHKEIWGLGAKGKRARGGGG